MSRKSSRAASSCQDGGIEVNQIGDGHEEETGSIPQDAINLSITKRWDQNSRKVEN